MHGRRDKQTPRGLPQKQLSEKLRFPGNFRKRVRRGLNVRRKNYARKRKNVSGKLHRFSVRSVPADSCPKRIRPLSGVP
jgi:hypothetical protein